MDDPRDTIFAQATAPGKAGVAIVRISGPESVAVLEALGASPPPARHATVARLRGRDGTMLDEALVLRFEAGASFTGEAVVELHLHGSIAIVRAVLREIEATGLARIAAPGEFTRRALMNDRLDLVQVQGLRDLIDAETEMQRRHAMRVYAGEMSAQVMAWRAALLRAAALTEAVIDFAEEEVPTDVRPEVDGLLASVIEGLSREIAGAGAARRITDGFEVALVGPPNVGKSSLLNALANSEAALVSSVPGTTRDVIEVRLDLGGFLVILLDMAGIRDTSDPVERLGIDRARMRAVKADMRLFLAEGGAAIVLPEVMQAGDLIVRTKVDLHGGDGVSARSGAGIADLVRTIADRLSAAAGAASLTLHDRDRHLLMAAHGAACDIPTSALAQEPEIVADAIRGVSSILSRVIGQVDAEDVLSEVFASFCIGK